MLFIIVSIFLRRYSELSFEHFYKISRVHIANLHADFIDFLEVVFSLWQARSMRRREI